MKLKASLKLQNGHYRLYKNNDPDIFILLFFLVSEIRCSEYSYSLVRNWLLKAEELEINLNTLFLEKEENIILFGTFIFDSDGTFFRIPSKNFLNIIDQWKKLCTEKPKEILIKQAEDGTITLEGNNNIIPDALLKFHESEYRYGGTNTPQLKNLALFLIHEFKTESISHNFIIKTWLDDSKKNKLKDNFLLIEKKDDSVSIFYQYEDANKEFAFVTTKEKLRDIYKQFQELTLLKPNVIRIYQDGDEIKLEGLKNEI